MSENRRVVVTGLGAVTPVGNTIPEMWDNMKAGKNGIGVACGDGTILYITELQAEGKKRMAAADYLRGNPVTVG